MGDRKLSMSLIKDISRNNNLNILNEKGFFTAEFVNVTGKPKFYDTKSVPKNFFSKTRCMKINKPVLVDEEIVAFRKVQCGYCALYLRN